MATSSFAKSLLGSLGTDLKAMFHRYSEYVFDHNFEFGPVDHQQVTANFRGVYLRSTTAADAGTEFSVAHGLARVPNVCFQVADPLTVNSQIGVPLTVSRAADANRVYLTSTSTGVVFHLYCE